MYKVAIIDMFFTWPPHGGACVDVVDLATNIQKENQVKLFLGKNFDFFPRGSVTSDPGIPIETVDIPLARFRVPEVCDLFKKAVADWKPDIVFIANAHFLKPHLVNAFADEYPTFMRFYTYECLCLRKDGSFFVSNDICPHFFTKSSSQARKCIACGLEKMIFERGDRKNFLYEFFISGAHKPVYYRRALETAMKKAAGVVVYNTYFQNKLAYLKRDIMVVPSGTDLSLFPSQPIREVRGRKKVILMTGRIYAEVKGFFLLFNALKTLAKKRDDFEFWITLKETEMAYWEKHRIPGYLADPLLKLIPWKNRESMAELYHQADICVFPSTWIEPCGIVAIEAMACGRPVVVPDRGGLADIVRNGLDGVTFKAMNEESLGQAIESLLDSESLRRSYAEKGIERAKEFSWDNLYRTFYDHEFRRALATWKPDNG